MANQLPVHVEPKEDGWVVVREGSERASSIHPTQSEAPSVGREIARRDGTEFFLHAQDGRVREHRNYGEGPAAADSQEDKGLVERATGTAGMLAGGLAGAASAAVGGVSDAVSPSGSAETQETERSGGTVGSGEGTNQEGVRFPTVARQDDASRTPEERYASYEVYDRDGERLGKTARSLGASLFPSRGP